MPVSNATHVQFSIDANASLFTVQAFASGIISVIAHSPKFAVRNLSGRLGFVPGTMEDAWFEGSVNLASLDLMDEVRMSERREIERIMFDEVLETNRYPQVEYKSTRVTPVKLSENTYKLSMQGRLSLHGVSSTLNLDVQVMAGEETLKAQGTFTLSQSHFGLKIASIAGGSLTIKDELKFAYYVIARRQG